MINGWKDGGSYGLMEGWMNTCMDGWRDRWADGGMDERMHGWMEGERWTDG